MKILICCERSSIVKNAFLEHFDNVHSCDLLPAVNPVNHFQVDALEIINDNYDFIFAFPPCTYLSDAGNRWLKSPGRLEKRLAAAQFFLSIYNSNAKHVAIENPKGFMSSYFRRPDQVIHPYYFGDNFMKRTCLWLKNLPIILPPFNARQKPNPIYFRKTGLKPGKPIYSVESHRKDFERDIFFPETAKHIAAQWSYFLKNIKD